MEQDVEERRAQGEQLHCARQNAPRFTELYAAGPIRELFAIGDGKCGGFCQRRSHPPNNPPSLRVQPESTPNTIRFPSSPPHSHRHPINQPISSVKMVLAVDLLNPSPAAEARKHKLKTLVPAPRSFFMDVKCPGCFTITTVFSHAQTVVICQGCTTVLCQPTGGKARLTEGCSFRRK
ncbi:Putative zinc-binding ribosomal protein [Colletotrichum destructivum]|nr:Putative zinc-binding ribosomal protein [Colletotrichum destructivum]